MAIKLGTLDISAFKVGSGDCSVYLGDTLLYPTTPPRFQGKWLATYAGGTTSSAECDSTSAITENEISKNNLIEVEIGGCVTSIGQRIFRYCRTLTSVTIGNSVSLIGPDAFGYCSGLTSVIIPDSVTDIRNYAFSDCTALTSITVNATTPPTLSKVNAFNNTNNCPIYVPSGSVNDYKAATNWSSLADRIQAIPT